MIVTDLGILTLLCLAAFAGTRRGLPVIALELTSFALATLVAVLLYHAAGGVVAAWGNLPASLANVTGFIVVWMIVEVTGALLARWFILRHVSWERTRSWMSQVGGAILNVLKGVVLVAVGLILFAALPLSQAAKEPILNSFMAKAILATSDSWRQKVENSLGRDLGNSLNFFTVTSDPESQQRIELGFSTTNAAVDSADEAAMLKLINHERTSRGIAPLAANPTAQTVARAYSKRMLAEGYFSHIDPDGHNPFDRMRAGGVTFGAAGENLALAPTLDLAHQGLMNSPGHRANILNPTYRTVGIGIMNAGPYGLMVTQDFTD